MKKNSSAIGQKKMCENQSSIFPTRYKTHALGNSSHGARFPKIIV